MYNSVEDVNRARSLRNKAEDVIGQYDFQTYENVIEARKTIMSIYGDFDTVGIQDILSRIDNLIREYCTFHGQTFTSYDERVRVETEYNNLHEQYSELLKEDVSSTQLENAMQKVDHNSAIHWGTRVLFEKECQAMLCRVRAREKGEQERIEEEKRLRHIASIKEMLATKYGGIDCSDHSRKNYQKLIQTAKDLQEYDTECVGDLLSQIQAAISECERLYTDESQLKKQLKNLRQQSDSINLLRSIFKKIAVGIMLAFIATLILPGGWKFVGLIGAIGNVFYESGDIIRESKKAKENAIECELKIKEIQQKINSKG